MDDAIVPWLTLLGVIVVGLGFFIGKWQDARTQCNWRRRFARQAAFVLSVRKKDRKTLWDFVVVLKNGALEIKELGWIIEPKRIYAEQDIQKLFISIKGKPNTGFSLNTDELYWRNGAPTIFADYDTCKPLRFADEEILVSAEEAKAAVSNWGELTKKEKIAQLNPSSIEKLMPYILLLAILAVGALAYMNYDTNKTMTTNIEVIRNQTIAQPYVPPHLPNGTIVYPGGASG